jgi:hypothetical protein
MNRFILFFFISALAQAADTAKPLPLVAPVPTNVAGQKAMGVALAKSLRGMRLVNQDEIKGNLRIRKPRGKRENVPVIFRAKADGAAQVETFATAKGTLQIRKTPNKPNEYLFKARGAKAGMKMEGEQLNEIFAGSDFTLGDLGLEFLQWPNQQVIGRASRLRETCNILLSKPEKVLPGGYSHVKCWVEIHNRALLCVEAYRGTKRVKLFQAKSFKKLEGEWQLRELELRNDVTDARTQIQFDLRSPRK